MNCNYDIEHDNTLCFGAVELGGEATLQNKSVKPSTKVQEIVADGGFDGLNKVTILAVDSTIDMNILPENIKKGVTILGVVGTYEPGSEQISIKDLPVYTPTNTPTLTYTYISDANDANGGEGYQIEIAQEIETMENTIKQTILIDSTVKIVGIQQFNDMSNQWDWINGSPAASLKTFNTEFTTVSVNGVDKDYTAYINNIDMAFGARQLRFYTTLPKGV